MDIYDTTGLNCGTDLIVIINNSLVKKDGLISYDIATKNKPKIQFKRNDYDNYCILTVDPDAPSATSPIYKYWLHMLIVNNENIVIPYEPPNPPKNSGLHRYFFLLYKQKSYIDVKKLISDMVNNINNRKKFNLEEFVKNHNLELCDSTYFKTELKI